MTKEISLDWKKAMAAQTGTVSQETDLGGIPIISLRHGRMTLEDKQLPNDEVQCIILGAVYERAWYDREFSPDDQSPPDCFALDASNRAMVPHENVPHPPSRACAGCPMAEFGSARQGKGPACKTRLRLLLMPAPNQISANDITSPETDLAIMKVSPTSVSAFAARGNRKTPPGYEKVLADEGLAPWAVISKIRIRPHDRFMHALSFEKVKALSSETLMAAAYQRVTEAEREGLLMQGWQYPDEPEPETDAVDTDAPGQADGVRY